MICNGQNKKEFINTNYQSEYHNELIEIMAKIK